MMGLGGSDYWTDERVEKLKTLWAEGLSNSAIAAALGGDVSRNAVIGKVSRLKLNGACKKHPKVERAAPKPKTKPLYPGIYVPRNVEAGPPLEIDGKHITILQINDRMCKFPIGDPTDKDFHFCGLKPFPGRVYCEPHWNLAHQPIMPRRAAGSGEK